jgi:hypothetical protein
MLFERFQSRQLCVAVKSPGETVTKSLRTDWGSRTADRWLGGLVTGQNWQFLMEEGRQGQEGLVVGEGRKGSGRRKKVG